MDLKNRVIFWIRFVAWFAVGCVTPIAVFAVKFGLFKASYPTYDELGNYIPNQSYALNGWGIVSCILIGLFLLGIVREVIDAQQGYSLAKQCWVGISKTIPLIIVFATLYFLNGVIEQVMFCLLVVILCKLVSIPLNPMPKWKYDKHGKEEYDALETALTNFVKSRMKRGDV